MDLILIAGTLVLLGVSYLLAPRVADAAGFFQGRAADGAPPDALTLTLSQVTTWIFARSLLTAAILGYHYGIAGALAYAAYYLSFLTGGAAVDAIRFRHGCASVQDFMAERFGGVGVGCYNVVIALRLLSEVFANLLVVGIVFGIEGSGLYTAAIIAMALVTLGYSTMGGLRASLRTDVFQMSAFAVVLAAVMVWLVGHEMFSFAAVVTSSPFELSHGWNLLLVALLQVWSYPLHDPVMMDRGFISDRASTRASFLHAAWISVVCILAFAMLGVFAGEHAADGEAMTDALARLLGDPAMTAISLALIISAVSTLDSTLSSAAKLAVVDMRLARPTLHNGRIAMAACMAGGLAFLFAGSKDLYDAVAVSGTASMFLAPVVFFCIWGGARVPLWCLIVAFAAAVGGAALYYMEAGGHAAVLTPLLGVEAKYTKLLLICIAVLAVGNAAFALGRAARRAR
jgi:Na+/proline symporter